MSFRKIVDVTTETNYFHEQTAKTLEKFTLRLANDFAESDTLLDSSIRFEKEFQKPDFCSNSAFSLIPDIQDKQIEFFGTNNLGVSIKDKNTTVVVLLIRKHHDHVLKKLTENNSLPSWLAAHYAPPIKVPLTNPLNKKTDILAIRGEHFPNSLAKKISDLHDLDEKRKIFQTAAKVGLDITSIFKTLNEKDILWTDLKVGNLMLRNNNSIGISDIKAFLDLDHLAFCKIKAQKKIRCVFDATSAYLSDAQDRLFVYENYNAEATQEEILKDAQAWFYQEWQKEYPYQLAVVLYHVLTNREKFTNDEFDFNHAVFKSGPGKLFMSLIKDLSCKNPDNRISIEQAACRLAEINHGLNLSVTRSRTLRTCGLFDVTTSASSNKENYDENNTKPARCNSNFSLYTASDCTNRWQKLKSCATSLRQKY